MPLFIPPIKDVTSASWGVNPKLSSTLPSAVRSHSDLDFLSSCLPSPSSSSSPLLSSTSPLCLPWDEPLESGVLTGLSDSNAAWEADVSQATQKHHCVWWHLSPCSRQKSVGSLMREKNQGKILKEFLCSHCCHLKRIAQEVLLKGYEELMQYEQQLTIIEPSLRLKAD